MSGVGGEQNVGAGVGVGRVVCNLPVIIVGDDGGTHINFKYFLFACLAPPPVAR